MGTMGVWGQTTWGGDNGDHSHGGLGTTWRPSRDDGDDVVMMGMTWGPWGPHGDNEITKTAITFERIEIIQFCLMIWDP